LDTVNRRQTEDLEWVYEFPVEFREQILALMLKPGWLNTYRRVVKPAYFPDRHERHLAEAILEHTAHYGTIPTEGDLLADFPEYDEYIKGIFKQVDYPLQKTQDEIVNWAKDNEVRLAFIDSMDYYQKQEYSQITARFEEALKIGNALEEEGYDLIEDIDKWLVRFIDNNHIPTPWPHVNNVLGGGLGYGELGVILAPAGGYKSTVLMNLGFHAAGFMHRKNVLYFSLEMAAHKVLGRFAANALRRFFKSGETDLDEYKTELREAAEKVLRGRVKVIQHPTGKSTIDDLKESTNRQRDAGFHPDMIIVDYPDLLSSKRNYREKRFELQEIYTDLRGWGVEESFVMWGASQARRSSFYKKIITMEDAAEDIGKVQISDVIMAVCRTLDEAANKTARFFMAKVRDGESLGQIKLKINHYPTIVDEGYVKSDPKVEENLDKEDDYDE
jgi:replicative DNA helicase